MMESLVIVGERPGSVLGREYGTGTVFEAKYDSLLGTVSWQGRIYVIQPAEKR